MPDSGYYMHRRSDLLSLVPPGIHRVLDVGCGAGNSAGEFRQKRITELIGIESNVWAASEAEKQFDHVYKGDAVEILKIMPNEHFDLILYADILEHLTDPWKALEYSRKLLADGGYILISVPNVRHWRLIFNLVFRGRWTYQNEGGTLDRTHLRFFTKYELQKMVCSSGFRILEESHNKPGRVLTLFNCITLGFFREFTIWQLYLLACKQS